MKLKKLSSGFLITDIESAPVSVGTVRLAPKILQSGAEQLARSATYLFAAHKLKISGASAAINSTPDQREAHVASFLNDVSFMVSEQSFLPDIGKGISESDLALLRSNDQRAAVRLTNMGEYFLSGSCSLSDYCVGVSSVTAVSELLGTGDSGEGNSLEGKSVTIEGMNASSLGALDTLEKSGAKLIGVSVPDGFAHNPEGFDIQILKNVASKFANNFGEQTKKQAGDTKEFLAENLDCEILSTKAIFRTPADILFAGSKMGALDHENVLTLQISALGSLHPIPFTTRAMALLNRKSVLVPPDFLCLGGQIYASGWKAGEGDEEIIEEPSDTEIAISNTVLRTKELIKNVREIEKELEGASEDESGNSVTTNSKSPTEPVAETIHATTTNIKLPEQFKTTTSKSGLFLAGCKLAEDFLLTWQDQLPFGRPIA